MISFSSSEFNILVYSTMVCVNRVKINLIITKRFKIKSITLRFLTIIVIYAIYV